MWWGLQLGLHLASELICALLLKNSFWGPMPPFCCSTRNNKTGRLYQDNMSVWSENSSKSSVKWDSQSDQRTAKTGTKSEHDSAWPHHLPLGVAGISQTSCQSAGACTMQWGCREESNSRCTHFVPFTSLKIQLIGWEGGVGVVGTQHKWGHWGNTHTQYFIESTKSVHDYIWFPEK